MTSPDLSEFRAEAEAEELRKANRALEQRLRKATAKTAELAEVVLQAARDAAVVIGRPPAVPKPKRDTRLKHVEGALLMLSDWHVGKATSSFNTEVACSRVGMIGEKVARIAEIERADHPVRDCHAMLGGDLVENLGIFPGQAHEVDSSLYSQLFAAAGALERLLRHLLSTFESVHCWEQAGNHGRLGRKGDHPRRDNADLLLYRIVRERFVTEPRLVWHEARSWFTIVEAGEYRALLVHGDQIRSFGGNVPAYGIARKVNAWATGILPAFTDVMLGHFHQPLTVPLANGRGRAFVNPSLESDSNYAKEFVAATGTPGQRLFFVDPKRARLTSERILWLDEV